MDTLTPLIVKNLDPDINITIGWNNNFVTIPPGEARTATFDAVVNYFGDPRAVDNMASIKNESGVVGWVPDRATEMRRLQCKWGNNFGMDEGKIFGPDVEITTLEGERIWTVYEDPEGTHVNPRLITIGNQQDLETQVKTMQKQLETLQRMQQTGELPTANGETPPVDDTTPQAPVRNGKFNHGPRAKSAQDDG